MRTRVIGHHFSNGELRANLEEGNGATILVERDGSADMECATRLEYLPSKREQAEFEDIAVGRLLVYIVQAFQVDIGLAQGRHALVHALAIEVEPIRHLHIQLQEVETTRSQVPQREPARSAYRHQVFEDVTFQEIEAIDSLNGNGVRWRSEGFGVEIGSDKATPIECARTED